MRQLRSRGGTRAVRALAIACVAALAVAGCSGDEPEQDEVIASGTPVPEVSAPDPTVSPDPVEVPAIGNPLTVMIAIANGTSVDVYESPGGEVAQTVDAADVLTVPDQTPLTFLVDSEDESGEWINVHLPVRPNGSTGWIAAEDVELISTDLRIEIALDEFELVVYRGSQPVLSSSIGVGTDERPTPGGVYYIRELLQPPDPGGVYGPYAYGLSGYSPVLDSFNGGDAVIGIHGTNDPDSIGTLASSGCIRLPNDVITELVNEVGLPLGTPVYISEAEPVAT
jgi:lipoprotein-anchoring transpeptidase ErfK/SrfK